MWSYFCKQLCGFSQGSKAAYKPVRIFGLVIQHQKPKGSSYAPIKKISLPHPQLHEESSRLFQVQLREQASLRCKGII
jgi:hypothetical protein